MYNVFRNTCRVKKGIHVKVVFDLRGERRNDKKANKIFMFTFHFSVFTARFTDELGLPTFVERIVRWVFGNRLIKKRPFSFHFINIFSAASVVVGDGSCIFCCFIKKENK